MVEIRNVLSKAVTAVKGKALNMQKPIMWIVIAYMLMVFLLIVTYYGIWLYKCWHGEIVMNDLLLIIKEVTGTSMIACVTFIGGCFVDMDGDGIPDKFQK